MGIPKKGLRESQLKFLTAGSAVEDGSHETYRVTFIEQGILKKAFYKKIDPKKHYPELLGKFSVATSLFKRVFQGKRSAEERLVFDENDKIIGTLSLDVEGFKPFNFSSEAVPSDTHEKRKVVPDTETLIEAEVIKLLFGRWYLDDDDGHPHNISLVGDIDFDMFFYWFTILMKVPRSGIGIPKERVELTVRDWETFPIVKDSKPYHWSTYQHPGQETLPTVLPAQSTILTRVLPKIYADPTQFEKLAHDERAQEQKFAAALQALLTFQPEVVRKRLAELFGDMTFNYTSLDEVDVSLRVAYEKAFPDLCNEKTNTMSFVDLMMDLYQKHYDNLYRVVVFYMGCQNNGHGIPLPATHIALYSKPSFYRNIEGWVKNQNLTTYYSTEETGLKYDLTDLQKRYHQIWRDAYTPTLNELLHNSYRLANSILFQLSEQTQLPEIEGKKIIDDSLTSAWEMIGSMPQLTLDKIESLVLVEKEHNYREALKLLVKFTQKFRDIVKTYYEKKREDLTEEDNHIFVTQLRELYQEYNLPLRQSLFHTSSHAANFNLIAKALQQFTERVDFQLHLTTTDEQMKDVFSTKVEMEILPHTHEDIIRLYTETLFQWAKEIKPDELSKYINEIITKYYKPTIEAFSLRHRARQVSDYLTKSDRVSGDDRLAYIFSSGKEDSGALNTLLIQHLTDRMLESYPLTSVRNAIRSGSFVNDISIHYCRPIVEFAKHDKRFTHLYSDEGIKLVWDTVYKWVGACAQKKFKAIIESALKDYEGSLWWGSSRRSEVEGYLKTYTDQAKILAFIFLKGEKTSTFSSTLFQKIIAGMKYEINKNPEKQKLMGNNLILQYNSEEHTAIYDMVKKYAEPPSQRQDTPHIISALTL